jgi:putative ABC transport system permease protein
MADELQCHLEMHIEDNIRAGMTPEEARRHAVMKLGGLEQTKEIYRDRRGLPFLETSLQDVRYGLRVLARDPGFTAVAIVTLALGIAANSTIFTLVNSWILRPPRIKEPARVVAILMTDPAKGGFGWDQQLLSAPDFVAWREQNHSFERIAASELSAFALTGNGDPERLTGMRVSADYFDVLGVNAALGRTFVGGEDQAGHAHVVILSHGLWQRRFDSDPGVIGKTVRLNGERYTVAGIMPSRFRVGFYAPQLWTPLTLPPERLLPLARVERNLSVVARLKQGVNVETAKAEMATLASRAEQTHPGTTHGWGGTAMVLQKYNRG